LRAIEPQRAAPGETLVVLLGDSITEGIASFDYVALLGERMSSRGYRFMNAGVGGDTAWNLRQRLGPVIASDPDRVVVQVGSNDVLAHLNGGRLGRGAQLRKRLPGPVTLEGYLDNVRQVIATLRETTSAEVAVVSIPVMGEDLASRANVEVRRFNDALRVLAAEMNVPYLAAHEAMEQVLRDEQRVPGVPFDASKLTRRMVVAVVLRLRGWSWDEISARNGLLLTTETLHLNGRGAAIVADVVEQWLEAGGAVGVSEDPAG
jgi:acyl-CoA thioesterase I